VQGGAGSRVVVVGSLSGGTATARGAFLSIGHISA